MEIRKNKLQALIGAIKNYYIQSKLRLLTCWQQAVGKTDCVEDVGWDCEKNSNIEIRNQNSWKPKYWRLFYPLDYLGFTYIKWYCWKLYTIHATYDNGEKVIELINIDYSGNRDGFIKFSKDKRTAWDIYYKRFSIYYYVSYVCYEGNADRARKYLSNKCEILNIAVFLRTITFKYFKYRGIISKSNVEWIRTD